MRVRFMRAAPNAGTLASGTTTPSEPLRAVPRGPAHACRRASGRKSWRRWAACRPASRTRSAIRWRRSRRPTRCCSRTACRPTQQRLTQMVADNVERLKRLVDDVMEVAPGARADAARDRRAARGRRRRRRLGADAQVAARRRTAGCASICRRSRSAVRVRRRAPAPRAGQPARQRAAPCQRAARRDLPAAGARATTAGVAAVGAERRRRRSPPEIERHLFEPFFSHAQPRLRAGPVYLPRAVRALRRQHRLPAAPAAERLAQRIRRDAAARPLRPIAEPTATPS